MGLSRSSRIITLLVIDTIFFFLEIIVGYAVHSLALVADSFHMVSCITCDGRAGTYPEDLLSSASFPAKGHG